jgi:hypothetical protein
MKKVLKRQHFLAIELLLLIFSVPFWLSLPAMAQECKGPNLNLTIREMKGEVTKLTCGSIGRSKRVAVHFYSESRGRLSIPYSKLRRISMVRDEEGKIISMSNMDPPHYLATIVLRDGESRKIYVRDETIAGRSSWGTHTFHLSNLQTVEFD